MLIVSTWPRRVAILISIGVIILTGWLIINRNDNTGHTENSAVIATYKERLPKLKEKVADQPKNATNRVNYAVALYATGDLKGAKAQYEEAVKLDGSNATTYNNLGNVYRDSGDTDAAVKAYEKAIEVNGRLINPYYNLANIQQYTLKKPEAAVQTYQRGLKILPDNEQLMLSLGLAYEAINDNARAEQMYQAILVKNANNAAAKSNLERVTK